MGHLFSCTVRARSVDGQCKSTIKYSMVPTDEPEVDIMNLLVHVGVVVDGVFCLEPQ